MPGQKYTTPPEVSFYYMPNKINRVIVQDNFMKVFTLRNLGLKWQ
jgi:hypothetical protein